MAAIPESSGFGMFTSELSWFLKEINIIHEHIQHNLLTAKPIYASI